VRRALTALQGRACAPGLVLEASSAIAGAHARPHVLWTVVTSRGRRAQNQKSPDE
jgi:hypothetical protein